MTYETSPKLTMSNISRCSAASKLYKMVFIGSIEANFKYPYCAPTTEVSILMTAKEPCG